MDYVIKNGTVCLEGEHFRADVTVREGKIQALGQAVHSGHEQVIDADGLYVCPGGIDAHTHMDLQQSPQYRACDDFYSGGVAAACGGTTTILDHMAFGPAGCSLRYPFERYRKLAVPCPVDYSFHGVIQHVDDQVLQELGQLIDEGFPSFKAYTTYGYPVGEGPQDLQPIGQAKTRPNVAEAAAVSRVLAAARACGDAPVYIVHTSAHESLDQLRLARRQGQRHIYSETCPQYLLLTEEKFRHGGPMEGIKYMLAPPLRKAEDNQALWQALADGTIQTVATDHCPFTIAEKQENVSDFRNCPGGVSGVEERMPLLFSEGVLKGRLTLERFVQVTSANVAKIFGLYPRKGTLLPGSDADIVLIDPKGTRTFARENLHTTCGYSPYEGMTVQATIRLTMLRGEIIAKDNQFCGKRGYGTLLYRFRDKR